LQCVLDVRFLNSRIREDGRFEWAAGWGRWRKGREEQEEQ
jgi:hypothetical protein